MVYGRGADVWPTASAPWKWHLSVDGVPGPPHRLEAGDRTIPQGLVVFGEKGAVGVPVGVHDRNLDVIPERADPRAAEPDVHAIVGAKQIVVDPNPARRESTRRDVDRLIRLHLRGEDKARFRPDDPRLTRMQRIRQTGQLTGLDSSGAPGTARQGEYAPQGADRSGALHEFRPGLLVGP